MWCVDGGFQESILVAATPAISLMFLGGFPGVPRKNEPKGKHKVSERPSVPHVAAGLEDSLVYQGHSELQTGFCLGVKGHFPHSPIPVLPG